MDFDQCPPFSIAETKTLLSSREHFRKQWKNYVNTWFSRPGESKKLVKIFPRPTAGPLHPIVRGQTLKYNMKVRAGWGLTLEELKDRVSSCWNPIAPTIGISVDHRRKNRSLEGFQVNVLHLKTYKQKLVVFPRHAGKFKAGDSAAEVLANATQVQGPLLPIQHEKPSAELMKLTADLTAVKGYDKLQVERVNVSHVGARAKKASEAEKEEKK
ncbi:hypothetical protein M0R45_005297 [Rubus argutus]|uniref:60S ribosomal protein L13 n=1 Tax=Rubus argutus TaxID=59490 RepID=A0AAW1YM97_RUBAR